MANKRLLWSRCRQRHIGTKRLLRGLPEGPAYDRVGRSIAGQLLTGSGRNRNDRFGMRSGNKMVYRGGCVTEHPERSPSKYDEPIGVA